MASTRRSQAATREKRPTGGRTRSRSAANGSQVDPTILNQLEWRSIGPHRGGRVVAVAGDPSDPSRTYRRREAGSTANDTSDMATRSRNHFEACCTSIVGVFQTFRFPPPEETPAAAASDRPISK